jgi:hypothetical protein
MDILEITGSMPEAAGGPTDGVGNAQPQPAQGAAQAGEEPCDGTGATA